MSKKNKKDKDHVADYMLAHTLAPCHGGAKKVFSLGKVDVWGSSSASLEKVPDPLLAQISLCDDITTHDVRTNKQGTAMFNRAINYANSAPCLACMSIDWSDREAPPVDKKFWQKLYEDLKDKSGNLIINCFGGHGRTGTALLSLANVAGIIPKDKDGVLWLREIYCEESIESKEQIRYLKKCGVTTNADEIKFVEYTYTDRKDDNWTRCTTCPIYATPAEVKACGKLGVPVRCGYCTGEATRYYDKNIVTNTNKRCTICDERLTEKELQDIKEAEDKVDICTSCNRYFGKSSISKERYFDERDFPKPA